jgi:transcriptional regulator with XRE-family HTH domain
MVGARLRRTRLQQRLSIRRLAELAKISKTSVLQVESGKSSRQSTYLKVAAVLGLHLEILQQPGASAELPFAVHRHSDDSWFDLSDFGGGALAEAAQRDPEYRHQLALEGVVPLNILACRLEQGRIKPTIIEVSAPSATRSHAGEEHVFVLAGRAVITVGDRSVELDEGESITFWSAEPHAYAPHEDSPLPVKLLSVRVDA